MENENNLELYDLRYLKPNYNTLGSDYQVNIRPPYTHGLLFADFDFSKPRVTVPGIEQKGFKQWLKNRVNNISSFFGYRIKPTYEINQLTPGTTFTYKPFPYIDSEGKEQQPLSLYSFTYNPGYIFEDERKAAEAKGETPMPSDWVRSVQLPIVEVYGEELDPNYTSEYADDENGNPGPIRWQFDNNPYFSESYLPDPGYNDIEVTYDKNEWLPTFEKKVGKSPYKHDALPYPMFSNETTDPNDPGIMTGEKVYLPNFMIEARKKRQALAKKGAPSFYMDEKGKIHTIVGRLSNYAALSISDKAKQIYDLNNTEKYHYVSPEEAENMSWFARLGVHDMNEAYRNAEAFNYNRKLMLPADMESMMDRSKLGLAISTAPLAIEYAPLLFARHPYFWGSFNMANIGATGYGLYKEGQALAGPEWDEMSISDKLGTIWNNQSTANKIQLAWDMAPLYNAMKYPMAKAIGRVPFDFLDKLKFNTLYRPFINRGTTNAINGQPYGKFNAWFTRRGAYLMKNPTYDRWISTGSDVMNLDKFGYRAPDNKFLRGVLSIPTRFRFNPIRTQKNFVLDLEDPYWNNYFGPLKKLDKGFFNQDFWGNAARYYDFNSGFNYASPNLNIGM